MLDSDMVMHLARQHLVLDLDGVETGGLGQRDGAMYMGRIAPPRDAVENDRQVAGRAHVDRDIGQFGQRQVGLGHAFQQSSDPPLR